MASSSTDVFGKSRLQLELDKTNEWLTSLWYWVKELDREVDGYGEMLSAEAVKDDLVMHIKKFNETISGINDQLKVMNEKNVAMDLT